MRRQPSIRHSSIVGWILLAALVFTFDLTACALNAAQITVFAAASLKDCLKEISSVYPESKDQISFNFAASSFLARQIEEGAPADIFFSADEAKMDSLDRKGLIDRESRRSLLSNSLVIVVAKEDGVSIRSTSELVTTRVRRVALADPKTVPAGIYAREYLQRLGLWKQIEPKVVPTDNVRAALSSVESGNVEAGIVFKTDARISTQVEIAFEVPVTESPRISYPAAVLKESGHPVGARQFLEFLSADTSTRIFEKHGFVVLKQNPKE